MSDRLSREKEYHNKAFSQGVRKAADKYYTIHKISLEKLYILLQKHASGKRVLEYGCGPGHNAFFLAQHARELFAIDISDFAIETAAQKANELGFKNARFIEMNAEELEFEDNSFDLVFGNSIIHHLDLEKSFAEIKRVLKPGGKAIFYEPLGHNMLINHYRKATPQMRTEDEHPLLMKDITLAKQHFKNLNINFYHLSTLAAVPLRNTFLFDPLLRFFNATDQLIFTLFPFMKKQAWFCILELSDS
ncbi:MAG: class I SAM-dependent methyltransferase [Bacteroidales bacterium]